MLRLLEASFIGFHTEPHTSFPVLAPLHYQVSVVLPADFFVCNLIIRPLLRARCRASIRTNFEITLGIPPCRAFIYVQEVPGLTCQIADWPRNMLHARIELKTSQSFDKNLGLKCAHRILHREPSSKTGQRNDSNTDRRVTSFRYRRCSTLSGIARY
jgi:hypothetical protein